MYRTAASPRTPDTIVLCRACAAPANVAFEDAAGSMFVCAACQLEQPVLRDGAPTVAKTTLHSQEGSDRAYEELSAFLGSLGAPGKATQVTALCDGVRIDVAISLSSGTVTGADVVAQAAGLPEMTLYRESRFHRDAKAKGVAREVQIGDAAFDDAVYIESPMGDHEVRVVLTAPAVRTAVVSLLQSVDRVTIGNGVVSIYVPRNADPFDPKAIYMRLAGLRAIAGAPRPMAAQRAPVPRAARVARASTFAFAPIALATGIGGAMLYGPVTSRPYLVGVGCGLAVALVLQPLIARALSGRSSSHIEILQTRIVSFVFGPFLVTGALFFYNALFDHSPGKSFEMNVVSTSIDDDDHSKIHVTTKDDHGDTHDYTFLARTPNTRARVRTSWRAGALGWTWETGEPTLLTDPPR